MDDERILTGFAYPSQYVELGEAKVHFIEAGEGTPILFLHGVPTSSYIWRNIIPYLATLGRCIAPDLIGFGRSDKPNIEYTIFDHVHYIEKFIEALQLKDIILIMHGWGSVIGFDYAMRHEKNCKGLVFYEAFLRSLNGDDLSLPFQQQWLSLEGQENMDITMNGADFVDKMLPQQIMRQLSEEELGHYREPFMQEGTGKPILQYIKELCMPGNKQQVEKLIAHYSKQLMQSKLPKLMLYSVPGFITTIATIMWAKEHLSNLEMVDIGEELHLAQETFPRLIGETISAWLQGIDTVSLR